MPPFYASRMQSGCFLISVLVVKFASSEDTSRAAQRAQFQDTVMQLKNVTNHAVAFLKQPEAKEEQGNGSAKSPEVKPSQPAPEEASSGCDIQYEDPADKKLLETMFDSDQSGSPDEDECDTLKEVVKYFDSGKDGVLGKEDSEKLKKMLKFWDSDENGFFDHEETSMLLSELKEADVDGEGTLSDKEFESLEKKWTDADPEQEEEEHPEQDPKSGALSYHVSVFAFNTLAVLLAGHVL